MIGHKEDFADAPDAIRASMKVAIIDDTPLNLVLMEKLVSRQPACEPVTFTDPALGLAWCLGNEPDLIIVDYMMPVLDGLAFIDKVRCRHERDDVPILMVTANGDRKIRYEALRLGANDFLNKPVDANEFGPRVRNMLKLRQAHLDTRQRAEQLASEVRVATAEIHERELETIMLLARMAELRDPGTGSHIRRMSRYSALIAKALGFPPAYVDEMLLASPLHDVGKLGIPDRILLKRDVLDREERLIMMEHARIGYEILKDSASKIVRFGASIALSHHERFDGGGYPRGLGGNDIPIEGRIVAVADVFDAITSERPYKSRWLLDAATDYLRRESGSHFDPECVDAFFTVFDDILAIHTATSRDPGPDPAFASPHPTRRQ